MTLSDLGDLGDFIGGLGVIATLLYLSFQIRQNTKSSRTESYQAAIAAISEWTRHVGTDSESSRIVDAGSHDLAALSPAERVQFNLIMAGLARNLENIHYQYLRGTIDEPTWSGWAMRTHSAFDPPGAQQWWHSQEVAYSPEFRQFVNEERPPGILPESIVIRSETTA